MNYIINEDLKTHQAKAKAECCGELIISEGGGRFKSCTCGGSFIDQERFDGRWVRLGGKAKLITAECPPHCKLEEHKKSYERDYSHSHCWDQVQMREGIGGTPTCGQQLADHKQCCLCDTEYSYPQKHKNTCYNGCQ